MFIMISTAPHATVLVDHGGDEHRSGGEERESLATKSFKRGDTADKQGKKMSVFYYAERYGKFTQITNF